MRVSDIASIIKNIYNFGVRLYDYYIISGGVEQEVKSNFFPTIEEGLSVLPERKRSEIHRNVISAGRAICLYSRLTNIDVDATKLEASFIMGLLARLQDDLLDQPKITVQELGFIGDILEEEISLDEYPPKNEEERLLIQLYQRLTSLIPKNQNPRLYEELRKGHKSQIRSLQQRSKEPISYEELREITRNKAGFRSCLFPLILNPNMSPEEYEAFFYMGVLAQYLDDIRDHRKDKSEGIRTLVTEGYLGVEEYKNQKDTTYQKISELPYSQKELLLIPLWYYYLNGLVHLRLHGVTI